MLMIKYDEFLRCYEVLDYTTDENPGYEPSLLLSLSEEQVNNLLKEYLDIKLTT